MPVWPGAAQVVHGNAPVAAGCAMAVCRWRPGGAPVTRRCYYTRLTQDKTWSKVSSLQSISHNSNVFQEKNNPRNVAQECLDRISALKKKPVKKAVPFEEPSTDDDTSDRISPSAMPLKKRPAKKTVQEEEQLSDEGSSDSSPPNIEKFIF